MQALPERRPPGPLPNKVNHLLPAAMLAYTHVAQKKGPGQG